MNAKQFKFSFICLQQCVLFNFKDKILVFFFFTSLPIIMEQTKLINEWFCNYFLFVFVFTLIVRVFTCNVVFSSDVINNIFVLQKCIFLPRFMFHAIINSTLKCNPHSPTITNCNKFDYTNNRQPRYHILLVNDMLRVKV